MSIAKKINRESIYKQLADKYEVSYDYVCMIANGRRIPTKKKGLDILNELKNYIEEQKQA